MMGRGIGLASAWEAGTAMLSAGNYRDRDTEIERDRQTDRRGEGAMRALLAPSRQANGWVFGQAAGDMWAGEHESGR